MSSLRRVALPALLAALLASQAQADVLVPKSGKPVRGALVEQTAEEVIFNPYWSRNHEMTWGVLRLSVRRVKRVDVEPHPRVEVFRRLAARRDGDTAGLVEIGRYAKARKLKAHAAMCWSLALAEDETCREALDALGGRAKWEAMRRGNVHLDADLREALRTYVKTDDPTARREQAAALGKMGFDGRREALERYRRSARAPRGLHEDRPLAWASEEHAGALYTLFVPEGYDPTTPWPLILGLHGGGADGKKGDEVVGSGRMAMNFYRDLAAQRGYLVACPNALHAPWGRPENEAMVRALLEELKLTYNVDLDRIYMTGHSMGGFGTWALGPRMAEDLAALSPMAGGGRSGIGELVETRTPIFIYHSDDDYVSVEPDRSAAKRLADTDLDFVYTELPGKGHSLPAVILVELFDFFDARRRYDKRYKETWPRSSLHGKVTKEEKRYLGDPLAEIDGDAEGLKDWIQQLKLGGGRAAHAAERIASSKPAGAVAAVSKIVRDTKAPHDARAWAARALGGLGDLEGCRALRRAVSEEASLPQAQLACEAARALAMLADPEGGSALAKGIEAWTLYYEGKVSGETLRFSDWERTVPTLAVLVAAWDGLPENGECTALDRTVVKRVLAPAHAVATSERIPQDASVARTALATAVAEAYAHWGADDAFWDRLLEAVADDEKAKAAVGNARP